MSSVETNKKYMLNVGKSAKNRLTLLNEIHGKYSRQFIKRVIKAKPTRLLDMGCGTGNMTLWLAEYFPDCHIVGLDSSEQQLKVARQLAKRRNISNVTFCQRDLLDLSEWNEKFDVIYCRYCLIHLENPQKILNALLNNLTAQGKLLLEEPTMSTAFCYPRNVSYNKSRRLLSELAKLYKLDFELGKKLPHLLYEIGYQTEECRLVQPVLKTISHKQMLVLTTEECRKQYLRHGLISEQEFHSVIDNLQNLITVSGHLIAFPRTTQICASKNIV